MKHIIRDSVLVRTGAALFGLSITTSLYATGYWAPEVCVGGAPEPSTLVNTVFPVLGCDAVEGEVGCGVSFHPSDTQKSCTVDETGDTFTFTRNPDNSLSVNGNGSKLSTVGFREQKGLIKKDCLAVYSGEPVTINGAGVIQSEAYNPVRFAFACKKNVPDEQRVTNLPYINARAEASSGVCEEGETFVGDPATDRGVCVRCLSPASPPLPDNNACPGEDCTDVFQVAVFDTDTKNGNLIVAECGPPADGDGVESFALSEGNADSSNQFRQCEEDPTSPDTGEDKCKTPGEITSSYEYYGGGSAGCGTSSGRRVCVRR
jgi:hypothetical protein